MTLRYRFDSTLLRVAVFYTLFSHLIIYVTGDFCMNATQQGARQI